MQNNTDASPRLTSQLATSASSKLFSVQYLRAVAALMVAYLHLLEQAPDHYRLVLFPETVLAYGRLKAGVDIFFVISGFIMLVTSRKMSPRQFAVRRIIRIVPMYWLITLSFAAMVWIQPVFFPRTVQNLEYLVKSLLFIPFVNAGYDGNTLPLLAPGWTLNFEMYFYAIFAIILFAKPRYRLLLNGLVFIGLLLTREFTDLSNNTVIAFYTRPQIFEFWCGMLIGEAYLKRILQIRPSLCFAAVAIGFLALLFNWHVVSPITDPWSDTTLAYLIPAALIVLGTVAYESTVRSDKPKRLLTLLGDASYSIYLCHPLLLGAVRAFWRWLFGSAEGEAMAFIYASISMMIAITGGVVVYWALERPMLNVMHKCLESRAFARDVFLPTSPRR
jgi:exopolysaccharide production protein ExoZ